MSDSPEKAGLIPVTLLTGFLGSGKTSLLNQLVKQPEFADALIIINEFGEMALDHMLVAHSTENVIMEMGNGCLCCTIRGDLVKTLQDITWRFARGGERHFSRVLIETTGLADPAPILHTLMTHPQLASRYRLDGVITLVDACAGDQTLDQHMEAVKQAAVADVLLLSKQDLVSAENFALLKQRLRKINPAAPQWSVSEGEATAGRLLNLGLFSSRDKVPDVQRWLREEAFAEDKPNDGVSSHCHHGHHHDHHHHDHHHDHHDVNRHDDRIRAFCFAIETPLTEEQLTTWLEVLMSFMGENILRVKGILNIQGQSKPLVIHGVQHIFHPPVSLPDWPTDDQRSRLVFITRDIGREVVESALQALTGITPVR
ncbi:MAG: CobW family GTP-binding protein [Nitrincola lacisaponensis]|uniref:CobW family GTP-binding protein n=1 Tax=Nitrincola lacisaponensis TaxID=267850 RepID=UPI0039187E6F